jgi:hypothetical protein
MDDMKKAQRFHVSHTSHEGAYARHNSAKGCHTNSMLCIFGECYHLPLVRPSSHMASRDSWPHPMAVSIYI